MNIGIDARSLEGGRTGVGRYLLNILERWGCISGHNFTLYFKDKIPVIGILERPCYKKIVVKAPFGFKSNFYFQHFLLPDAAKKDGINVLFSPSYILPWNWKGKSVVTIHDVSYEVYPDSVSFLNNLFLRKASRRSAEIATKILTISEFSKREIVKYYHLKEEKIAVTPLGVDEKFQKIVDEKKINSVKSKYGITEDYIVVVGSIFNRRHLPETISGFSRVAEKMPKLQLLIIGKNHTHPFIDIEKLIADVNNFLHRNAVLHVDFAEDDDLLWIYNGAKLSVYLSDYEGFGLPPLESIACGTPAIVSNIPTEKEIIGDAGLYVDDNKNVTEIGEKIIAGLEDEKLRNSLILKGYEDIKTLSWKKCASQTLNTILNC